MKKIMFNDRYGLTEAVLDGSKTQTRRIMKGKPLFPSDEIESAGVLGDEVQIIANGGESLITMKLPFRVGEVVAVAQSYRNCGGIEMKKRIRKTGEIIDVINYYNLMSSERDTNDSVSYIDSKGVEHPNEKGLNLWWDFEDVEEAKITDIDWEQVRVKAAISALQGFTSNSNKLCVNADAKELAIWSVCAANELIAELKEGGEK